MKKLTNHKRGALMKRTPNEQRHDDVSLETYIRAVGAAVELLRRVHQDLIVLRSDVDDREREDADISALGSLTAAEAVLLGAVRYHEEGAL